MSFDNLFLNPPFRDEKDWFEVSLSSQQAFSGEMFFTSNVEQTIPESLRDIMWRLTLQKIQEGADLLCSHGFYLSAEKIEDVPHQAIVHLCQKGNIADESLYYIEMEPLEETIFIVPQEDGEKLIMTLYSEVEIKEGENVL